MTSSTANDLNSVRDMQGGQDPPPVITRACDRCRRKKIRCEPVRDGCVQCETASASCHFTPISTQKRPRRPPGYRYIAELQDKLRKMQSLVQDGSQTGHDSLEAPTTKSSPFGVFSLDGDDPSSESSSTMFPAQTEPSVGLGANSSMAMLPLSARFGESDSTPPQDSMRSAPSTSVTLWNGSAALSQFSRPSLQALPPKAEAIELARETFQSFNRFIPLFDEESLLASLDQQYTSSVSAPCDIACWACINVVLSLAHRYRAVHALDSTLENTKSCNYIHNSLAVVSGLSVMNSNLPAVQALLGMAIVLRGSPNPQTASVLIALAMRQAQALGLHRKCEEQSLTNAQLELRRRVFWIAYCLDRDTSLRTGKPFTQDDDEIDVELPSPMLSEAPFGTESHQTFDYLGSLIGLCVIQGRIYKLLYSAQGARLPAAQKAVVAQELSNILLFWRNDVTIDFEADAHMVLLASRNPESFQVLGLRFTYVHSLVMVDCHLPSPQLQGLDAPSESSTEFPAIEKASTIESRKAMELVPLLPQGDYVCVWMLLHSCFAAATALLNNVLSNASSPFALSDLLSVQPFLQLLALLTGDKRQCVRSEEAERMQKICVDLNSKAEEAVFRQNSFEAFDVS